MIHGVPVKTYNALQNHIIVLLAWHNLDHSIYQSITASVILCGNIENLRTEFCFRLQINKVDNQQINKEK